MHSRVVALARWSEFCPTRSAISASSVTPELDFEIRPAGDKKIDKKIGPCYLPFNPALDRSRNGQMDQRSSFLPA